MCKDCLYWHHEQMAMRLHRTETTWGMCKQQDSPGERITPQKGYLTTQPVIYSNSNIITTATFSCILFTPALP